MFPGWTHQCTEHDTAHITERSDAAGLPGEPHARSPVGVKAWPGSAGYQCKSGKRGSLLWPGGMESCETVWGRPAGMISASADRVQVWGMWPAVRPPGSCHTEAGGYQSGLGRPHQDTGGNRPPASGKSAAVTSARQSPPWAGPGPWTWIWRSGKKSCAGHWEGVTEDGLWKISGQCYRGSAAALGKVVRNVAHQGDRPVSLTALRSAPSAVAYGSRDTWKPRAVSALK